MMFLYLYVDNPNHGKNINKKYSKYFHKIFRIYGDYFDYDVSDSGSDNSLRPHERYSSDFNDYDNNRDTYFENKNDINNLINILLVINPLKSIEQPKI